MRTVTLLTIALICTSVALGDAPSTRPTSRPAKTEKPINGFPPIRDAVPQQLYPPPGVVWTQVKADAANDYLKVFLGRQAIFTFKVKEVGHGLGGKDRTDEWKAARGGEYWIDTEFVKINTWRVGVMCYFNDDDKDKLAALNPGDKVTVQGALVRCELHDYGKNGWLFALELGKSRLVK